MIADTFVPIVVEDIGRCVYVQVLVQLQACGHCKTPMVPPPDRSDYNPFPGFYKATLQAQAARAGFRLRSDVELDDGRRICVVCVNEGAYRFRCAACGGDKPASLLQEIVRGDPPDRLCRDCFETMTASAWAREIKDLEETHRYDHTG